MLAQKQPNPCNPKRVIRYWLAKTSVVQVSVYNLFGQKVAILIDKKQLAGSYRV